MSAIIYDPFGLKKCIYAICRGCFVHVLILDVGVMPAFKNMRGCPRMSVGCFARIPICRHDSSSVHSVWLFVVLVACEFLGD